MMEFIAGKVKKYWGLISAGFLWLCVWATYNTDIFKIFSPGFPHGPIDIIHGLRSFFPFVAIILAIAFLIKKRNLPENFFLTPLGLLGIYTIIGITSSVFSKNPLAALYWGVLYGSIIIVLLAILTSSNPLKKLSLIININWTIAGILAFSLLLFFLVQPSVLSSFTFDFLICVQRPYESLASIGAGINTFGMAGTRPTGLGRYAGIVAIIALVSFFYNKKRLKIVWFLLFVIFLSILLFSKGKTGIVAFIIAMIFIICLARKINIFSIFGVCFVSLLAVFIIFYNIPCTNSLNFMKPVSTSESKPISTPKSKPVSTSESKSVRSFVTLSGRVNGVWLDSWHLFLSNPLIGYGFQADRFSLDGQHAHNTLVQALVQTGLLGSIPLMLAFILAFIYLCRAIRTKRLEGHPGEKESCFLIGIAGVFVFFAVRAITESSGAYFDADWLFLAPIIAYIQCLKDNKPIKFHED